MYVFPLTCSMRPFSIDAEVAQHAVDGADEVALDRPQPLAQIADEEVPDRRILVQRLAGRVDVDLVRVGEPAHQPPRDRPRQPRMHQPPDGAAEVILRDVTQISIQTRPPGKLECKMRDRS